MSTTSFISLTAAVVALAVTALVVLVDQRQSAATPSRSRRRPDRVTVATGIAPVVADAPAPTGRRARRDQRIAARSATAVPYRPPRWWQRLRAFLGTGFLVFALGVVLAAAVGLALAIALFLLNSALG